MEHSSLLARISRDPAICDGRPFIKGTDISVAVILDALAENLTTREILDRYPNLTADDIQAARLYVGDHARQESKWNLGA